GRELGAAALVAVVVERFDAGLGQAPVNLVGRARAIAVVGAHVDQADLERGHALRPDDAIVVMARLDDRADQTGDADAITAAERGHRVAIRATDGKAERRRIFVPEIEDMADLDAARASEVVAEFRLPRFVALLVGRRIIGGHAVDESLQRRTVTGIHRIVFRPTQGLPALVEEDLALARRGE